MSIEFAEFTERLVSISDFSQGKAGRIFTDVAENDREYIVLKNNQPTAVVISVKEYKDTQQKIARFEKILDMIENMRLLKIAESRAEYHAVPLEDLISEEGFSLEELEELAKSVELE